MAGLASFFTGLDVSGLASFSWVGPTSLGDCWEGRWVRLGTGLSREGHWLRFGRTVSWDQEKSGREQRWVGFGLRLRVIKRGQDREWLTEMTHSLAIPNRNLNSPEHRNLNQLDERLIIAVTWVETQPAQLY